MLAALSESPAAGGTDDAIVRLQIIKPVRRAIGRKIGRGSADQELPRCDARTDQAGIFQLARSDGEIKPLGNQVDKTVRQVQRDFDLWIILTELPDDGRDVALAKRGGAGDLDFALRLGVAADHREQFVPRADQRLALAEHGAAGIRE